MNTAYSQLARARIKGAVAIAQDMAHVQHDGLRGRLREIVARDILRPFLPTGIEIGTGEVVSATDQHSPEMDIVLYDPWLVPPIAFEGDSGLFPIESVLYTIEVKSTLTREELTKAHRAAMLVNAMAAPKAQPISVVLAFSSDLTASGKGEAARYAEIRGSEPSVLRGI